MVKCFSEIKKYQFLIYELVERDIKKKYRRSILGVLWSILNPLLMMAVTAMVFSTIFRFQIENYPLYLMTGQILFAFYSESTNFAMASIIENASLLKKIYIPKYLFILSRVMSSCVNLLLTIPALVVIIFATGQTVHLEMIAFLVPLALLLVFCTGIGLFMATAAVYFRDVFHIYTVLLSLLSYATPIFYPEEIIPNEYHWLIAYNPLCYYLKAFRETLYMGVLPEWQLLAECAVLSVLTLMIGVYTFKKHENHFILYV